MVDQYLSIGESAKRLGVSIDTVRRWEKSGKLRAYRLDGKNRSFIVRDIDALRLGPSVSAKKAASYLKVSRSTLRRRALQGHIPVTQLSNRFRKFSFEDLEKYKESLPEKIPPTPPPDIVRETVIEKHIVHQSKPSLHHGFFWIFGTLATCI